MASKKSMRVSTCEKSTSVFYTSPDFKFELVKHSTHRRAGSKLRDALCDGWFELRAFGKPVKRWTGTTWTRGWDKEAYNLINNIEVS